MPEVKKTILIVEDELPLLDGISDKLGREGFKVLSAKDGVEGLELALKEHPDFILLDKFMPNMDGLTMLKELRKDQWGQNVMVMIWSNSKGVKSVEEAKQYNIVEFLIKSDWTFGDIVKKIKKYLGVASWS